jgi:serine phosphatase RsbU (regulator of sigma subunit)
MTSGEEERKSAWERAARWPRRRCWSPQEARRDGAPWSAHHAAPAFAGAKEGPSQVIRWNIVIAVDRGQDDAAESVRQRLAEAWNATPEPAFTLVQLDDLAAGQVELGEAHAAVLPGCGRGAGGRVRALLGMLEEAGVPALVLLDHGLDAGPFELTGAMVDLAAADAGVLAAKLQGLVHRHVEVRRLRREVALVERFQGGLRGEITRMHEELQLAAMVQRELLPRELPALYGMEFGALWRPAHYVSGDIYDVARLDDDHIGVFIADAVGHGVPAALMTMFICHSLCLKEITGSSYRLVPPSEVLSRLNDAMIRRRGRTTRFATAIYGLINCRERTLTLAGAGHPPPILFRANGSCEELETEGGLLGVFDDETYQQITVELGLHDRMVLYSDGFEQAFPSTEADVYQRRLPTTRYRDEFQRLVLLEHPCDVVEALGRLLDDQCGSLHQVDDLTMICAQAGRLDAPPQAAGSAGDGLRDVLGTAVCGEVAPG